jgi:hypothetical protein
MWKPPDLPTLSVSTPGGMSTPERTLPELEVSGEATSVLAYRRGIRLRPREMPQ